MEVIGTKGLDIVSPYSSRSMFRELKRVLWRYPSEQFAFMAQRVLEKCAVALAGGALEQTGYSRMAVAGGVFSNIKMNMQLLNLPGLERLFVFPTWGRGARPRGGARANRTRHRVTACRLTDLYLGPQYTTEEILAAARSMPTGALRTSRLDNPAAEAARLILGGEIVLWFQGRMEIGPRALGHRSILARPDDRAIKDRLNLLLKKRVWYQPFCPSMLIEDAPALLETEDRISGTTAS